MHPIYQRNFLSLHSLLVALAFSLVLAGSLLISAQSAFAYTTTHYNFYWCSGATTLGSQSQADPNSCIAYCAGLNAGCCTTNTVTVDFEPSYQCTAKSETTVAAKANTNTGTEIIIRRHWDADVINYAPSVPTVTLTANPASIVTGSSSTLTWSSTNATSCTGTNFTVSAISGSAVVSPTTSTTYSVTCTGAGGSASATTDLIVTTPPADFTSGTPALASGTLTTGSSITFSGSVTNGGGTNITSLFSNRFQIDLGNNDSYDTNLDATNSIDGLNISETKSATSPAWIATVGTHKIRLCTDSPNSVVAESNEGNNCGADYIFTISPPNPPTATVSATPAPITVGQSSTITWSSTNATTCTGTNFSTGGSTSGSVSVTPIVSTTYSISCTGAGGTVVSAKALSVQSATKIMNLSCNNTVCTQSNCGCTGPGCGGINVTVAPAPTSSLTATPSSITAGSSSTLVWSSTNASTCVGTGFSTGNAASGTVAVSPTITTLYTVACTGFGGTATTTATVTLTSVLPDLTSGTPSVQSGSLVSGATHFFKATITNGGTGSATSTSKARFQLDLNADGTYDTTLDATSTVSALATSVSGTAFSPNWTAVSGTHKIRACADLPLNSVGESNEGNNCGADYTFTITSALPDLTAGTPSLQSGSTFAGASHYFKATITNNGTASATTTSKARFQLDLNADGSYDTTLDATSTIAALSASGTGTAFSPNWTATAGTHKIRACADLPANSVGEGNEGNNCGADYQFTVSSPTPAATISASPTNIIVGSSATLTWSSTNATTCYGANFSTGGSTGTSVAVSPAATTTYSVACAGPGGTSATSSATVNVASGTIDFTGGVPSVNSGSLTGGQNVTFKGNITNGGTGSSSATFSNRFQIDLSNDGTWNVNATATSSITGLSAGQTKQVISPIWVAVTGTHKVRLCADTPASVSESSESNNCGSSYTYTVAAPPNAPAISGPSTGFTNTSYTFSFTATDPGGTTIRYGVDWDNNGLVDQYLPATGYVASGLYQDALRSWTATGTKTFKAFTQNSNGANSASTTGTITISEQPPPPPVVLITVTPDSIEPGSNVIIEWSSSNATSCTGTGFSTGGETSGSVTLGPLYSSQTYSITCTGVSGEDSDSATVTLSSVVDLVSGVPGLNSGNLYDGASVTFWASALNQGTSDSAQTFSNRFQVDLNNNGSWDTNLDATNSVTGLTAGQSKQVVSPAWTAVLGTHKVRMCADSPTSVVPETDESNNCSATYFVFTVAAMPECSDGDDNNDNELIDLADTFACTDAFDATEETLSSGNLSLEAFSTGSGDVKSGIVKPNTAASLHWSVANIIDGTCVITGENGDVVNISGASGSSLSQLLKTQTIYTLTCSDLNNQTVSIQTIVRIAPEFEER